MIFDRNPNSLTEPYFTEELRLGKGGGGGGSKFTGELRLRSLKSREFKFTVPLALVRRNKVCRKFVAAVNVCQR